MSISLLPVEVLEPILDLAIRPSTSEGALILLVCTLWHNIGRERLYEHVTTESLLSLFSQLSSQAGYDSYFLLGGSKASWRPLAQAQRALDYQNLRSLHLRFGPLQKLPFSLSSHNPLPPYLPRFPNLKLIHLDLAKGSSYLSCRPKPMARRVAKLIGGFSPETFILARSSSAEISLSAVMPHHLRKTKYLLLASHHISHLPSLTPQSCPQMRKIRVIPYPAVRTRDLKILCLGLRGGGVRVEVRWVRREEENWWDRVSVHPSYHEHTHAGSRLSNGRGTLSFTEKDRRPETELTTFPSSFLFLSVGSTGDARGHGGRSRVG
ncbi:hypothetical protein BDY24DRAFT_396393 [Mrakia frigida]|uniref:uncharacterized protein n=1 Tax=Mrakia frigida TaxID=29902 RepID=UPI003FCC09F5